MSQLNLLGTETQTAFDCRNYLTSGALHVAAIALLLLVPASVREPLHRSRVIPLVAPRLEAWRARPRPLPHPKVVVLARNFSPPVVEHVRPAIQTPAPAPMPAPPQIATVATAVPAPRIEVRPAAAPPLQVHTGVFGDPLGVAPGHSSNAKLVAARLGSFDGASAGDPHASGGRPGKALVANAGFGDGAGSGTADRTRGGGSIQAAGFGDVQAGGGGGEHPRVTAAATVTPVRILYKPKPVYTPEARAMKVQGDVLLEVVFRASGQVQIERVVQGLDRQLDEAAEQAAMKIRFRPATRAGVAVDTRATVNITFELT